MKWTFFSFSLLVAQPSCRAAVLFQSSGLRDVAASPAPAGGVLERVTKLCEELKEKIENDGVIEQESYDKYACWCEEALGKKAGDISKAKEAIDTLSSEIMKLRGEQATHLAEIAQLKNDIAAAIESQKEATAVREKEREAYNEEKAESEQCIGALEAAIKVLAGAGTGKSLLGQQTTLQEVRLLSVVDGVRGLLKQSTVEKSVSGEDLEVVRHFVERPEDFVGERTGSLSAAQIANNPYGDYAPQSARISGILKGMYDSFTADLERANAEEATKQKSFEDLMSTKKGELKTLEATLEQQTGYEATKTKDLATKKTELDATKEQLAADEMFFKQAKESCRAKASEWAQRTRMRTEELKGLDEAIAILRDEENRNILENATSTFLQLSSANVQSEESSEDRNAAYAELKTLATRYQSVSIAKVAGVLSSGGHFDKVIQSIDKMIELLRREEQGDIEEKDFCMNQLYKNKITEEDLNFDIEKINATLDRHKDDKKELQDKLEELDGQVNTTKEQIDDVKSMRAEEQRSFIQAVYDDQNAIQLLEEAIAALSRYYQKNKMPIGLTHRGARMHRHDVVLLQEAAPAPAPAEGDFDFSRPPETSWEEGEYRGHTAEAGGLVAILELLKEDLQKEIDVGRKEDAKAQAIYEADLAALYKTLDAQTEAANAVEKELAELNLKVTELEARRMHKSKALSGEASRQSTLEDQCAWVKTHFESRKTKRKAEIDGLIEAKNYLAGMDEDA